MQVIHVDDEWISTNHFQDVVKGLDIACTLDTFNNPEDSLEFAKYTKVDVAFLDTEMYSMNGVEVAKRLKKLNPEVKIIFLTAFNNYAAEAFAVGAVGYILKPYTENDIRNVFNSVKAGGGLKNFVAETEDVRRSVYIRTMPKFDIYVDGQPIIFNGSKVKELLAFLVDSDGSVMNNRQIITAVWEGSIADEAASGRLRITYKRLNDLLGKYGIADILYSKSGKRYVKTDMFDSDYRRLMQGDEEIIKQYDGRYMEEYSWAEYTQVKIDNFIEQREK